jgi:hypothetical protein
MRSAVAQCTQLRTVGVNSHGLAKHRPAPPLAQCRHLDTYIRRITITAVAPIATTAAITAIAVIIISSGSM